jgi:xylulokinase
MNLPVRIPAGSEAAAMGGAIQALWCLLHTQGKKSSIETLTDEHITLGDIKTPDKKSVALYNDAYAVYSKYLAALSPLYK